MLLARVLMPAANAEKITPAPIMQAAQARQAVMAAAARFQVSVNPTLRQSIPEKSVRISQTGIVFDGAAADQYNHGAHRYTIDFTGFTKLYPYESEAAEAGESLDPVPNPAHVTP